MDPKFLKAEELGIRLEIVRGLHIWEASPVARHQIAIDVIRKTIRPLRSDTPCACVHLSDVYVQFQDGSLKRPDIAIFCRTPDELDDAITLIPEAVIEVVSKGYEAKDFEIAPNFYLSQGVKDVIIFEPITAMVVHATKRQISRMQSPTNIELQCGCALTA